ncbi:hypothetical protein [Rhodococcus baikonurensis]|uniref:Uncharacterized protein n=1 Tax=Rhodococcus baikonurensis TaxID=172041 RepID=A0ABV5XKP7_9NOCA
MSERRRARAGAHAVGAAGAVPPELLGTFEEHGVWFDREASLRWFTRHHLKPWPMPDAYGRDNPPGRRDYAVHQWALGQGIESSRWPGSIDHVRLRALGITERTRGSRRLRHTPT